MEQELILWKDEADKPLTSKKNERKDTFIKIIDEKAVIITDIDKLQKPIWKVLKPVFLKKWKTGSIGKIHRHIIYQSKWDKYKQ